MSFLAIAATALLAATPLKLAAPSLQAVGVEEKKASAFTDFFAQQLSSYGIKVTTSSEIAAVLGHERQKAMLGCGEESNTCQAEMAGALGVDGIVTGNVARLVPAGYLMTLKIIAATNGSTMGNYSGRLPDESAVLDWLASTAKTFARARGLLAPEGIHLRPRAWIPAAAAVVLAGAGTFFLVDSNNFAASLRAGNGVAPNQLDAAISGAKTEQAAAVALVAVGAAALATAATFFLTGDEAAGAAVAVVPSAHGGSVSVGWRWP